LSWQQKRPKGEFPGSSPTANIDFPAILLPDRYFVILSDRIRQPKENQNPLTLPYRCDKLTYKLPSAG
jgi:hypothetical protein